MKKITPILENTSINLVKDLKNSKNVLKEAIKSNNLEKQPVKDFLDFSLEETGKYRIGDRIVSIIFPR